MKCCCINSILDYFKTRRKTKTDKDGGNKYDNIGIDENYDSDCDKLDKTSIYVNDGKEYINKRNQFYEPMDSKVSFPDQGFILPLELINFEEEEHKIPRHKSYSQVVNLQTGKALKRKKRLVQFLANENDKIASQSRGTIFSIIAFLVNQNSVMTNMKQLR